jgi:bacitracin transport system permease protein
MNLLVLFTSVFVPLLNMIILLNQISRSKEASKFDFAFYFTNNTNLLSVVFGPMLVSFIAIYLFLKEFKDDTLKTLLLTPIKRNQIYISKLLFTAFFSFLVIMLSYITALILGSLAGFNGLNGGIVYNAFLKHLNTAFMLISFIPFTFLLTLWLRNILYALFITLMGMITGMIIAGSDYSLFFPWSAVLLINSYPQSQLGADVWKPIVSLILNFIMFTIISYQYFKRKEI